MDNAVMPSPSTGIATPPPLEEGASPLLTLVQRLTGLETSFVTSIDWKGESQDVLLALNTSDLVIGAGSRVDWKDSMCRHMFLSGKEFSSNVQGEFPGSIGAEKLGLKTFVATRIEVGDEVIGTLCGASMHSIELSSDVLEMLRLIAESLASQLKTERDGRMYGRYAAHAEELARDLRFRLGEAVEEAARMRQLAWTDALTGLYNRRAFNARWEEELARSTRHNVPIAALVVDVDNFKGVNDAHGHPMGDQTLQALAEGMRRVTRKEDVLGRLGGDEFALAVLGCGPAELMALSDRLRTAFGSSCRSLEVGCTLSIGIASSTDIPRSDLLDAADRALYRSKSLGKDRAEF